MLKAGVELVGGAVFEHIARRSMSEKSNEEMTDEQQIFERRIRIAQNILGTLCPPAGKFMTTLEYGPVLIADAIRSDATKSLCRWVKNKL